VNLVLPPTLPEADAGFVIIEADYYVPMSGTNTICTVTALLETGMIPMQEPITKLTLEAPAGLVPVTAECRDGKCVSVTFDNVPGFVFVLDETVDVPGLGRIKVDVAYGGMIYCIVDAESLGGRQARRGRRADQASRGGSDPLRPSRESTYPHHQPDSVCRSAPRDARRQALAQHRHRLARTARSLALRHGHERADGGAARAWPAR
jgi:hypothetical protein